MLRFIVLSFILGLIKVAESGKLVSRLMRNPTYETEWVAERDIQEFIKHNLGLIQYHLDAIKYKGILDDYMVISIETCFTKDINTVIQSL